MSNNLGIPAEPNVHIGVWTNWSHGKILGATITLSQRNGNLLVAFIALFVSYVGTCFWRTTCFAFHRFFSNATAVQDALYHQRQAIFRNSANGTAAAWDLSQILWHSRRMRRPYCRVLPLIAYSVACALAFAVVGVFSSKMATFAGNEVLIAGSYCGMQGNPPNESVVDRFNILDPYISQRMSSYMSYAQGCYSDSADSSCTPYVMPRLSASVLSNASCPFREDICRTQDSNIKIDTGLLNSHYDLGFNAPESKRIHFRRILHCGPLAMDNFTEDFDFTVGNTSTKYKRFYYGPLIYTPHPQNHTYEQAYALENQLMFENSTGAAKDYSLTSEIAYFQNGSLLQDNSEFEPVEALQRNDADIFIMFLSAHNVRYTNAVDDFIYSAHQFYGKTAFFAGNDLIDIYLADYPATAVGCAVQYQKCLPGGNEHCTPLGGMYDLLSPFPDASEDQTNVTQWIAQAALALYDLGNTIDSLGAEALTSKYTLEASIQGPLQNNQWQLEVERLSNITLAAMQGAAVETATGPTSMEMREYFFPPENTQGKYFCRNQKIRSTAYTNFSLFGLSFIFVIGGLIILLNHTLEPLATYLSQRPSRRRGHNSNKARFARLEWSANGTLQLQRLAHEELGLGTWQNCDGGVPIAERDDVLGVLGLDDEDWGHPILVRMNVDRDEGRGEEGEGKNEECRIEEVGSEVREKHA